MKHLNLLVPLLFLASPAFAASVTANQTLQRGDIIQREDISVETEPGEYVDDIMDDYIGMELKRTVYAGKQINAAHVGPPIIVKRNSRVSMIYRFGRLEINAWGRALDEGGEGDVITIMNLESRKRIQGTILPTGVIEVHA